MRTGAYRATGASLIVLGLAGCLADDLSSTEAYCSYGAVSTRQLAGCLDHVTPEDFEDRNTEAARFARGEADGCGGGAGPLCDNAEAVADARKLISRKDASGASEY